MKTQHLGKEGGGPRNHAWADFPLGWQTQRAIGGMIGWHEPKSYSPSSSQWANAYYKFRYCSTKDALSWNL